MTTFTRERSEMEEAAIRYKYTFSRAEMTRTWAAGEFCEPIGADVPGIWRVVDGSAGPHFISCEPVCEEAVRFAQGHSLSFEACELKDVVDVVFDKLMRAERERRR